MVRADARLRSHDWGGKLITLEEVKARLDPVKDAAPKLSEIEWTNPTKKTFSYTHTRPLPRDTAIKAIKYITVIVKAYPVQIRYTMARPLWERFCDAWCNTGSASIAIRAI